VLQAALDCHLKEKGYSFAIIKDREFFSSRKVLEGKARKLRNEGKGKLTNKSRSLTREEEETLWESGQLGNSSPRSLLNTMWWLLSHAASWSAWLPETLHNECGGFHAE